MSQFLYFLGASRGCADFRDPTAVFRIITGGTSAVQGRVARKVRARENGNRIERHEDPSPVSIEVGGFER